MRTLTLSVGSSTAEDDDVFSATMEIAQAQVFPTLQRRQCAPMISNTRGDAVFVGKG
jgi:hypothetical protein